MVDGSSGGVDQGTDLNSDSSSQPLTPDASTQQQLAKPPETGALSESSPNAVNNLVSTNASNTL